MGGDAVIEAWEAALAETMNEHGEGRCDLGSVTFYLVDDQTRSPSGELVWEKNLKG